MRSLVHLPDRPDRLVGPRRTTSRRRAGTVTRTLLALAVLATTGAGTALPASAARNSAPIGAVDVVSVAPDSVTVSGWALDPDTSTPIDVHVYVDRAGVARTAETSRPDVGRVFGLGDRHGYTVTVPATPGPRTVCVYGINATPGAHSLLACRTVAVRNSAPIGAVDVVTAAPGAVTVSGWTLDPDTTAPIQAHVYVDSDGVALTADGRRPDVARVFGRGDRHGYSVTVPAAAGPRTVCAYGINATPGAHSLLACRTVTVPPAPVPTPAPTPAPDPQSASDAPAPPPASGSAPPGGGADVTADPSSPAAGPRPPALSWAPPALVDPVTVAVSAQRRDLRLDVDRDYVIAMPSTPLEVTGGLTITGGRNVVLVGGEIRISTTSTTSHARRGLYLKGQTGTVHVEGLLISGPTLADGINLDQRLGATVQLQNVRVETVHGSYEGDHADVVQTWAGPRVLRVDRLTGHSTYQGMFLLPRQFSSVDPEVFDLRRVNIVGAAGSGYLFWRDNGAWPIRTDDVWASPGPDKTRREWFLWARGAASSTTWDAVRVGTPATGDFVPVGRAGTGYVSPGYDRT